MWGGGRPHTILHLTFWGAHIPINVHYIYFLNKEKKKVELLYDYSKYRGFLCVDKNYALCASAENALKQDCSSLCFKPSLDLWAIVIQMEHEQNISVVTEEEGGEIICVIEQCVA